MSNNDVTQDKTPVEQAVELFVYAPLGFVLEARGLLPQLVERGRQQVTLARMIGQFAVQQGQTEATKALGKAADQANTVLTELGLVASPASEATPASPVPALRPVAGDQSLTATTQTATEPTMISTAPATANGTGPAATGPGARAGTGSGRSARPAGTGVTVEDLAIADYDSLAASQVIPRLPGLSSDELEAVRAYEIAHRGRKTILNRIAQLQSA